jgi:hypothetical protein
MQQLHWEDWIRAASEGGNTGYKRIDSRYLEKA